MPVLYGAPLSPFVRKVAITLEEKNIPFDWNPVRPHDRLEAFRAISPLGKIPAYKDNALALADSSVICFDLEFRGSSNTKFIHEDRYSGDQ